MVGNRIAATSTPTLVTVEAVAGVAHRIAVAVIPAVDPARIRDRGTLAIDTCTGHTRAVQCHPDDGTLVTATIPALHDA